MKKKFCKGCYYYPKKDNKLIERATLYCTYVKFSTEKITPYEVITLKDFACPLLENKYNNCPYYEENNKTRNWLWLWLLIVIFLAGFTVSLM